VPLALPSATFSQIAPAIVDPCSGVTGLCIAALRANRVQACRDQVADFGGVSPCALISGGQANPVWFYLRLSVSAVKTASFLKSGSASASFSSVGSFKCCSTSDSKS
jgi:hypothetical protein